MAENNADNNPDSNPDSRGSHSEVQVRQDAADGSPADAAAETGSGDPADPAEALERLRAQVAEYKDHLLRAQAESENVRRRAARDVENAHKYALEKFAAELLPVIDSLDKAVEVAAGSDAQAIAEGVQLSLKLFLSVLEKYGIERIEPAGEPFDPQVHEAMAMVPSPSAEPNSVLEVMQPGYLLNGRLVRAAKVVVAKAPDGG